MCGIFGYVGKKTDTPNMILDGLKLLEYRGYDSWGIAVKSGDKIQVEKHVGKIGDAKVNLPESEIGIGHTRWATHGGVTQENSHPHLDCTENIAVVHNGIIENYKEIKDDLLKKDHKFHSETDTEIFPHLIEEFIKSEDLNFTDAFRIAFNSIKGLNAIVAINTKTNEIAAAKTGSPLVVGVGEDAFYISSDPNGVAVHTDKALFIKDHEMVVIGKSLQLFSLPDGLSVTPALETLEKALKEEGMGEFPHFMIKEITEQSQVLENIANNYSPQIEKLGKSIKNAYGTYFIGAGTAYFACLMGTYLFSKIAKIHVNTAPASEFNYLEDFLTEKSLIIALSQSGETIDVVEPLQRAKKKGSKVIAITNVKGSSIYRMSDEQMLLGAGSERAVASTKVFLAKLGILLMLSYAMKGEVEKGKELVEKASKEIKRILEEDSLEKIKKVAYFLGAHEHIFIIGRGASYPAALEAALKIREVSYLHAEGLAGGELKHGSIALISKGTPVIVFAPNDETYQAVISNAMEVKARGGVIIGVSHENNDVFDHFIVVKDIEEGSLIAQILPAQIIAYYLAVMKNYDPDKPRNLAKSVTVK
ncbi:MAG: glutamine--fructose-6-phosphate transaminase (isomerizing) [Candidatus Levybacteria bacterium]|nr:glutamine--fructose-6-phosphate transaminase (isomerizing) [Candidatus Levybacteria bacterium]